MNDLSSDRAFTPGRAARTMGVLLIILVVCGGWAAAVGSTPISILEALREPDSLAAEILMTIRVPWVVLAATVGACLSVAGAAYQGLLRNPLADPFILGMSGGASLGVILALTVGGGLAARFALWIPLWGFMGALGATLLVWRLSKSRGQTNNYTLLLAGVVANAIFSAVIMFVISVARPEQVHHTALWLMGILDVFQVSRSLLAVTAGLAIVGVICFCALGKALNALSLGDQTAHHMGVDVDRVRRRVFYLGAVLVGAATAVAGPIGFVGLLVPHLLRLILGPDQRLLLPASALGGATFLLLAGSLARMAFPFVHNQVPVGVVTAALGGPFFLWLLQRRGRLYGDVP